MRSVCLGGAGEGLVEGCGGAGGAGCCEGYGCAGGEGGEEAERDGEGCWSTHCEPSARRQCMRVFCVPEAGCE